MHIYCSPTGVPTNDGTLNSPRDLESVLVDTTVQPGDTICLLPGTYRYYDRTPGGYGYPYTLHGTEAEPITVRPYTDGRPSRATIDGGFVNSHESEDVTFRDLEIVVAENIDDPRIVQTSGSRGYEDLGRPAGGFQISRGTRIKLINNIIHSNKQGVGFWEDVVDGEMYGNLIYDNGWLGPDRGHGHGVYTQNAGPLPKIICNNIFGSGFAENFHAYGGGQVGIRNYIVDRNILIGHACHMGGKIRDADGHADWQITDNLCWGSKLRLGDYNNASVLRPRIERNRVVGNRVQLKNGVDYTVNDNFSWDDVYESDPRILAADPLPGGMLYSPKVTGLPDVPIPTEPFIHFEVNQYDQDRAHVAIITFDGAPTVDLDLGNFLQAGDHYEIRNPLDYFAPVSTETFAGGPLSVSMLGADTIAPAQFVTFILLRRD